MKQVKGIDKNSEIAIISPPLVGLKNDPFGNIPSLPVAAPYLAAYLREKGYKPYIIDAFGENPKQRWVVKEKFFFHGLTAKETVDRITPNTKFVLLSVHSVAGHAATEEIMQEIKKRNIDAWIIIGGNFPTADPGEFLKMGADFIVLSEGELTIEDLIPVLSENKEVDYEKLKAIDGLAYEDKVQPRVRFISDLDVLPFPAIEMLPLQNYWNLGYSHGPFEGKYTFMFTSRGCPLGCHYCATPMLWQRKWRARSAKNMADEMEYMKQRFGITDFHIQDDNFAVNPRRIKDFCKELIDRKIGVTWQVLSTKAEQVDEEMLTLMKEAGCDYISMSPETGSPELIKKMNKFFNYSHFLKIIKDANKKGITTQACFILGYPGETDNDRKMTKDYIVQLAKNGLDEIGVYIITPLPGAKIYDSVKWDFDDFSELSYSPRWRKDYNKLNKFRISLYSTLLINKMLYHPSKLVGHGYNLIRGKYKTKIEAGLMRTIKTWKN